LNLSSLVGSARQKAAGYRTAKKPSRARRCGTHNKQEEGGETMRGKQRFLVCGGLTLALAVSAGTKAETLIYVTPTTIGTVDSANPAVDNTPGDSGPLGYTLPNGYQTQSAKVSNDGQTLFLLGSIPGPTNANPFSGTCQLFAADTNGSAGIAGISAVNEAYSCTFGNSYGDLDFVQGSGSSSPNSSPYPDAYIVANGTPSFEIPAGGASFFPTSSAVTITWASGTPNLLGVANMSNVSLTEQTGYGIDLQAGVVQLDFAVTPENTVFGTPESITGTETVVADFNTALGLITPPSPQVTSFDYSSASGYYYLYLSSATVNNDGVASFAPEIFATKSLSSGFTLIGSLPVSGATSPSGTAPNPPMAVVVAKGLNVSNNNSSGGAFAPACLLPLLALAALRRRRRA
jgi:hypothetical protein